MEILRDYNRERQSDEELRDMEEPPKGDLPNPNL